MSEQTDQSAQDTQPAQPDARVLLQQILTKLNSLETRLNGEAGSWRDFEETGTAVLEQYASAIATLQEGLYVALGLHLAMVGPQRLSDDPQVAAAAQQQAELAFSVQGQVAPGLFAHEYGIDPVTGETLPGREPGVPVS